MSVHEPLAESAHALDAITALCAPIGGAAWTSRGVNVVSAGAVPEPFRGLLVHNGHMTAKLKAYHGPGVELRVLDFDRDDRWYRRKILLTSNGCDAAVEFGIVRLDLAKLDARVRAEVLERRTPLGDILCRYDVMTRVEPRWFLKFDASTSAASHLAPSSDGAYYGRLATIRCDDEPAVELLEVVTDARVSESTR